MYPSLKPRSMFCATLLAATLALVFVSAHAANKDDFALRQQQITDGQTMTIPAGHTSVHRTTTPHRKQVATPNQSDTLREYHKYEKIIGGE